MTPVLREGIVHATLLSPALESTLAAYVSQLSLTVGARSTLDADAAAVLGLPALTGAPLAWLCNPEGEAILRVIEDPQAVVGEPMFRHGWLSLEVLVGDIDTLAASLQAPFRVLGEAADLELSPAIRASQVLGPCGEMLYLTQIKAAVPPFELPMTDAVIAVPFIGVMTTPDRSASQAAWTALTGAPGWAFDTRITVLNRAYGRELGGRYPVAVVPMVGKCMVEIDEVQLPAAPATRAAGLYSLCLQLPATDNDTLIAAGWKLLAEQHQGDLQQRGLLGPAGEHVEVLSAQA